MGAFQSRSSRAARSLVRAGYSGTAHRACITSSSASGRREICFMSSPPLLDVCLFRFYNCLIILSSRKLQKFRAAPGGTARNTAVQETLI